MRMIKEVLRLYYSCGLSQTKISKALGCSRGSVAEYLSRAQAAELSWPLPDELDDTQIERRLFPPRKEFAGKPRPQPDCAYIHEELKKKGVTLLQLWAEYKEDNPNGYGVSQFCDIYQRFTRDISIVMRQEHKAGDKAFSDFAGKTSPIVNPVTGEVHQAHLFVCTLGASNYTFAELFSSEDTEAWCNGHAKAFNYFGGCPKIVVPDNPKPVVTKACPYEPDINPSFAQMANHYDVAIIPARVRKPKDKAKVEAAVGLTTRWILAVLRNRTFFSLAEANHAVKELLEKLNERPFKKLPGCRRSLYEAVDKPALKPLPKVQYEYQHFKKAGVNIDYHIDYDGHLYSVPYQYRGEVVEVVATTSTVEIYRKGKRIASHQRSFIQGRPTTLAEHRPKNHREYGDWSPRRLISWANKIGPETAKMIEAIMQNRKYPEQGYRGCLGILRLSKVVEPERLEAACKRALASCAFSYKSVKSILDTGLDRRPLPEKEKQLIIVHSNIRGACEFITLQNNKEKNDDSPNNRQHEGA